MLRIFARFFVAAPLDNLKQTHFASLQRTNLGFEVRAPFIAAADIRENQLHHVFADFAAAHDSDWRNPHAFAVHIRRDSHRTGRRPADVGVMRAISNIEERVRCRESGGRCFLFLPSDD